MTDAPAFLNIHHLKLPVADLDAALDFYARALGAARVTAMDHRRDGTLFASILRVAKLGAMLELRLDPEGAEKQRGTNLLTLTVPDRAALATWEAHLAAIGAHRLPILAGAVGWLMAFEDGDGRHIRLYTQETHGPEIPPAWGLLIG